MLEKPDRQCPHRMQIFHTPDNRQWCGGPDENQQGIGQHQVTFWGILDLVLYLIAVLRFCFEWFDLESWKTHAYHVQKSAVDPGLYTSTTQGIHKIT